MKPTLLQKPKIGKAVDFKLDVKHPFHADTIRQINLMMREANKLGLSGYRLLNMLEWTPIRDDGTDKILVRYAIEEMNHER